MQLQSCPAAQLAPVELSQARPTQHCEVAVQTCPALAQLVVACWQLPPVSSPTRETQSRPRQQSPFDVQGPPVGSQVGWGAQLLLRQ